MASPTIFCHPSLYSAPQRFAIPPGHRTYPSSTNRRVERAVSGRCCYRRCCYRHGLVGSLLFARRWSLPHEKRASGGVLIPHAGFDTDLATCFRIQVSLRELGSGSAASFDATGGLDSLTLIRSYLSWTTTRWMVGILGLTWVEVWHLSQ